MSAAAYAERTQSRHLDGSLIFKTHDDDDAERETAAIVERAWKCSLRSWGRLTPIDWYAVRDERLVGVAELKVRSHRHDRFPTIFLNVRKWLALLLASNGLGVPALFIVRFEDGIRWITVAEVDASRQRIVAARRREQGSNDCEPMIDVPIGALRVLS